VPRGKGTKTTVAATAIITPSVHATTIAAMRREETILSPHTTTAMVMISAAIIPVPPMARAVTIATVPRAGIRNRPATVPAVRLRAVLLARRVSTTADLFWAVPLVALAVALVDHLKDAVAADPDLALAADGMVR